MAKANSKATTKTGVAGPDAGLEEDRGLPPEVDPETAAVQRNAAADGWQGASEVVENDFEYERLREASHGPDERSDDVER